MSNRDPFGLLIGSDRSKAAAIYSRPEGATLHEVKALLGTHKFDVLVRLARHAEAEREAGREAGFRITVKKEAGPNNRMVTRYFLQKEKKECSKSMAGAY